MHYKKYLLFALVLLLWQPFGVKAAYISCAEQFGSGLGDAIESAVSNSSGCDVGESNNDKIKSELYVNKHQMFGYSDWQLIEKYDHLDDGQMGELTFGDMDGYEIMVVLKGSNSKDTQSSSYVGFLIDLSSAFDDESSMYSISWESVFYKGDFSDGKRQDVSHITLYKRYVGNTPCQGTRCPDPRDVPEPSTLLILLSGVAGLLLRRQRN
ncbi:PEP-CTERM sorting domain-containing protein [Thalassotalea ponticola]|uniref:PEP-CTERM sorting domain-containing protein n=1 Tax=Thalassotalea ponticola TaxID=1523392 RepID=UPI0025B2D8B5|nr:PEP-CTERM sorting domain-containing protein [Thalassotalea ponticola]MDN3651714.1 PEP-CTERM sorting domain-containing protein [Thalassotalea ponticola]